MKKSKIWSKYWWLQLRLLKLKKIENSIGSFQLKVWKLAKFEVKIGFFQLKMLNLLKFEVLDCSGWKWGSMIEEFKKQFWTRVLGLRLDHCLQSKSKSLYKAMKRLKLGLQSNYFNTKSQKYSLRATSLHYGLQLHTLNQYQGLSVAIIDPHKVLKCVKIGKK